MIFPVIKQFFRVLGLLVLLIGLADSSQAKNFLWEVDTGGAPVYIFGSIHMAKAGLYPLNEEIEAAFAGSDILVVEADVESMDQGELQKLIMSTGIYPPDDSLEQHLSDRTKEMLKGMEQALPMYSRLRPWMLAVTLQSQKLQSLGFEERYGLDFHFINKARNKKAIVELESVRGQLEMFNSLTPEEQDLFLYSTLLELDNMEAMFDKLMVAWKNGDEEEFYKLFFKEFERRPELKPILEKMVFQRNRKMTAAIENFIAGGKSHFVIVGAGHLVGPESIISLLKEKGFNIIQR